MPKKEMKSFYWDIKKKKRVLLAVMRGRSDAEKKEEKNRSRRHGSIENVNNKHNEKIPPQKISGK